MVVVLFLVVVVKKTIKHQHKTQQDSMQNFSDYLHLWMSLIL